LSLLDAVDTLQNDKGKEESSRRKIGNGEQSWIV